MKEIQLNKFHRTKNYMKFKALVDDDDFDKVNSYNWTVQVRHNASLFYAGRRVGEDLILMHRFIMGVGKEYCIDHIDGNGLNCQKNNMRIATTSQNNMNKTGNKNASSIFKGVSFHKNKNKWQVIIGHKNKLYHLGYFDNEIEAALTYNRSAVIRFGKYARLNII